MIAFGIDPGSLRTGYGVVRAEGSRFSWIDSGVVVCGTGELADRLELIFAALGERLAQHRPDHVFLESLFHQKNARSALVLGHARGVALLSAQLARVPVREVAPSEVKQSVTGNGRADKQQVQEMVRILLGRPSPKLFDESDALAIAMAGAMRLNSPVQGVRKSKKADQAALLRLAEGVKR